MSIDPIYNLKVFRRQVIMLHDAMLIAQREIDKGTWKPDDMNAWRWLTFKVHKLWDEATNEDEA